MGRFKLRLVTYFLLLSLLPLLAASFAFSEVAWWSELGRTDSRLNAALRVASAAYAEEVRARAGVTARTLAHARNVREALESGDRLILVRLARDRPNTAFFGGGELLAGRPPSGQAARRSVDVVTAEGLVLGRVVSWIPLDGELVGRLRAKAGLEEKDRLLVTSEGEIVAGSAGGGGTLSVAAGRSRYVQVAGRRYRAVGTGIATGGAR
jgi:hypothetical protein